MTVHKNLGSLWIGGRKLIGWLILFFVIIVVLQWKTGAYRSEFGCEPDEAAHYVTGLVIRDYIAAHFPGNPLHYAKNYYDHYPKVALGHWPPFFYLIQTAWTLPLGASRVSVLLLMAFLAALAATVFFRLLLPDFGRVRALAGVLVLLALPLVERFSGAVMTEIPITLLVLLSAYFFIRFLEYEQAFDAGAFGVVAAVAILTKFSGLSLAFVPPLALLFGRRLYLLRRKAFWLPAILVAVLAAPWTILTLKTASDGMADERLGWSFTHKAVPYYAEKLMASVGIALLFMAVFGFVIRLFVRKKIKPSYAVMGALLSGILILHMVVPCGFEARHLTPALPAVVFFAWAGADWIAGWMVVRGMREKAAYGVVFGVAFVLFVTEVFDIPDKGYAGFRPVAQWIFEQEHGAKEKLLVCSDARGEGMFISEVAMAEKRPGHIVDRASKKLAAATWNGGSYKLNYTAKASDKRGKEFENADELFELLRGDTIGFIVMDDSVPDKARPKHYAILQEALDKHPELYSKAKSFEVERNGTFFMDGLIVYRRISLN